MKRVLLVANTQCHIAQFHKPLIKWLNESGYQVDVAARNNLVVKPNLTLEVPGEIYDIPFLRSPFSLKNFKAYAELKKVITSGHYDVIHCNTPVAGILTRIGANKLRRKGKTKVIYQAHGFHFYKGAPLKNLLLYYPVEKICSYFTDVLITINQEDYALAKRKMKAKRIEYVPGVGLDTQKFANTVVDRAAKRRDLGIPEEATVLMSVGELIPRKNHETVIKTLRKLNKVNIHYLIAGNGPLLDYLKEMVKDLELANCVHFIGYRRDIAELYKASDICVLPSIQEGLPVALMEAMACGMPVACSAIRGNTDLIDENGGFLFAPTDVDACRNAIEKLVGNTEIREEMAVTNSKKVKCYDYSYVNMRMKKIYENVMEEGVVCGR